VAQGSRLSQLKLEKKKEKLTQKNKLQGSTDRCLRGDNSHVRLVPIAERTVQKVLPSMKIGKKQTLLAIHPA